MAAAAAGSVGALSKTGSPQLEQNRVSSFSNSSPLGQVICAPCVVFDGPPRPTVCVTRRSGALRVQRLHGHSKPDGACRYIRKPCAPPRRIVLCITAPSSEQPPASKILFEGGIFCMQRR